jgi:hypothetical protein
MKPAFQLPLIQRGNIRALMLGNSSPPVPYKTPRNFHRRYGSRGMPAIYLSGGAVKVVN